MLIEFRTENHRSILKEQVLTVEIGPVIHERDERPRQIEGYRTSLLPSAALNGANGSGKSNILAALKFLRDSVVHSHRSWSPVVVFHVIPLHGKMDFPNLRYMK